MTTLILIAMVAASFLLGFLRDMIIAWRFGGSWMADALFVCLILPVFFENLLGIAVRDGVIAHLKGGRFRWGATLRSEIVRLQRYLWGAASFVAILVWIGADIWLPLLAPGWDGSKVDSSLLTFRVASLLIFVQAVIYFQSAVLNSDGRFLLPMWRPIALNLGAIGAMVAISSSLIAVVVGMLFGQTILLLLQQYSLNSSPNADVKGTEKIGKQGLRAFIIPLFVAALLQQLCVVAEKYFGSSLDQGSIALLSFGFRVATIPLTVFSLSSLTIIFPALIGKAAHSGYSARGGLVYRSFGMCLLFLVPASTVLLACPSLVISALFERGAFGSEQTALTAPLLAIYAVGVPAMGVSLLGGRILLARGKGKDFVLSTLVATITTLFMDKLLYRHFGASGLAAALAIGSWAQAFYTLFLVFMGYPYRAIFMLFARWLLAALIGYAVLQFLPVGTSFLWLALVCLTGLAVHLAVVALMGDRDWLRKDYWDTKSVSRYDAQVST
jgi:murein biosynthesis integral membrane protein MurJ